MEFFFFHKVNYIEVVYVVRDKMLLSSSCVEEKSDSDRRDSNPGSEPKTLTTALPSSDTS